MQTFMRQYGVADSILFPLYSINGSDIQASADFEIGDINLIYDSGTEVNATNLPVDLGNAFELELTSLELTHKKILVIVSDKSTVKKWLDTSISIETYGNENAEHPNYNITYGGSYVGGYENYNDSISADYNYFSDMPDPVFFNEENTAYDSEKNLYDLLITEAYNKNGVKMQYYVVSLNTNYDKIYGEDLNRMVERKFNVQTYYELPQENEYWSRFGIEGIDTFSMFVSKRHFQTASTYDSIGNPNIFSACVPKVGDIIKASYNNYFYEIITVKQQQQQFHKTSHSWEFIVKPMKDEKHGVEANMTNDDINDFMNISDIFDTSATVTDYIKEKLYNNPTEQQPNDPNAFWN
jgi:hypothetical protein